MSTRTALTVVGGIVGAYFGYPQLGLVVGSLVGGAVDPTRIEGPQINETGVQTSAEGVQRPIIWGTIDVTGNIMHKGPSVKTTTEESQGKGGGAETTVNHLSRSYAIRICEGPIEAIPRIWADNKLVVDLRVGSQMIDESMKWLQNKVIYLGDETQLPDPTLVAIDADAPSHRGTAYIVFILEDLTERAGSIPQYRFEVAKTVDNTQVGTIYAGPFNTDGAYWIDVNFDDDGNMLMLRDQAIGSAPPYGISVPPTGSWKIGKYSKDDINTQLDIDTVLNGGDVADTDQRAGVTAISFNGGYAFSAEGVNTNAGNRLLAGGASVAHLVDHLGNRNWGSEVLFGPGLYGGLIFMTDDSIYIGLARSGYNYLHKWPLAAGSPNLSPSAYLLDPISTSGSIRFHVSNNTKVRVIDAASWTNFLVYDQNLNFQETVASPGNPTSLGVPASDIYVFGADDELEVYAYVYRSTGFDVRVAIFTYAGVLLTDQLVISGNANFIGITHYQKVIFSQSNCIVAIRHRTWAIPVTRYYDPGSALLSEIVSDIYDRCGISSDNYDVSELTDQVDGFVCANAYTGADAIGKLIQGYWFDISGHDSKNWHPKRGAAVVETLTIDDLLELPDTNTREQAIERPKKLHLKYKHANSGYAAVKATAPRANSPDVLTTGEAIIELPVVLDENQAAKKADVMYKIVSTEVSGETVVTVPLRVGAKYVTGNALGLSLRGQTTRQRVDQIKFQPWRIELTLKPDRQSAYTSNLTGVPIPDPTLPPSTIVGETELAILDIPARIDSEDDLNYYVAVSGRLPPWYGARYQRSFDGGANYSTVEDITTASVMGEITNAVTDASEHFTDTTNTVNVMLYRDSQSIESITNTEFLSEGGAFALENADGSWEIMQYRDAVELSDGSFTLSTLHRGRLNSTTNAHSIGARLVVLNRPSHIVAQSSWLNTDLTHRAISLGESADDTDNDVTQTYVGRSQTEWPVEYLVAEDDSSGTVSASWVPRFRFGTDANPVNSINMTGYRVTITSGSSSLTFDTTVPNFTGYDASSLGESKTISVSALNRITGAGPATSKVI